MEVSAANLLLSRLALKALLDLLALVSTTTNASGHSWSQRGGERLRRVLGPGNEIIDIGNNVDMICMKLLLVRLVHE